MKRLFKFILAAAALFAVLLLIVFAVRPLRERVLWRVDQWRIQIQYALNPPEEALFVPDEEVAAVVQATLTQMALVNTPTPQPTATLEPTPTEPDAPTITPTTPLPTPPPLARIDNVPYVDQHYGFNNCAPANISMAMQFWGWTGSREDVTRVIKPFEKDKNVMPYELVEYVNTQTNLRALTRMGGTTDLLKRLVANGFPVIVESGVYLRDLSGKISWMGHYQVVYGYDDAQQIYQVKDSYEQNGNTFTATYEELVTDWRAFNYAFVVVYPPEKEGDLAAVMGEYMDESRANQIAAQIADDEIYTTTEQNTFFAWYNRGTSLVQLQDFNGAATAFDEAFRVLAALPAENRPWRAVWYQTGPYFAYYYSGRYYDVIALADNTIGAASEPYLEESWYWRAQAKAALGDSAGAVADLRQSLEYHPGFAPAEQLLAQLGATP